MWFYELWRITQVPPHRPEDSNKIIATQQKSNLPLTLQCFKTLKFYISYRIFPLSFVTMKSYTKAKHGGGSCLYSQYLQEICSEFSYQCHPTGGQKEQVMWDQSLRGKFRGYRSLRVLMYGSGWESQKNLCT